LEEIHKISIDNTGELGKLFDFRKVDRLIRIKLKCRAFNPGAKFQSWDSGLKNIDPGIPGLVPGLEMFRKTLKILLF